MQRLWMALCVGLAALSIFLWDKLENQPRPRPGFTKVPGCDGPSARASPDARHYAVSDFEAQRKIRAWVEDGGDERPVRLVVRAEACGSCWGLRVFMPDCLCNYSAGSDRSHVGTAAFFPDGEGAFVFGLSRKQCEVIGEGPFIVTVAPVKDEGWWRLTVTDIRLEIGE